MPYRKRLQASAKESPQDLLTIWREERSFRVGQILCYSGLILSAIATIADWFWSTPLVIASDVVLLIGCSISTFLIRSSSFRHYYWWPAYLGFWISILPSLWTTGGLSSPFFGADLVVLYTIGAVMDFKNRSLAYLFFALLHIPVFYLIEFIHPLSINPVSTLVPSSLIAIILGVTLAAAFICVHAMLRTEGQLSLEFANHYRDLTKTEIELKKSESQLREAQSIARIGSWEWDLELDRISWSEELFKLFGVRKENFDPSFNAYLQRLNPDVRGQIQQIIENSLKTGDDFVFENRLRPEQGGGFILSRGRAVKDSNNKVVKMLGTSQDISDRKQIELQLLEAREDLEKRVDERTLQLAHSLEREKAAKEVAEHASQAKTQFLANMSHEIRTPMNSILGFSDLLASGEHSLEDSKEYIARIRANGSRLLHLIDDILDLSKFEAGQIPIHKTPVVLNSLVEDVVSSFQPILKLKGLELKISYHAEESLQILTDAHRVSQIFTNLLSNSIKFSQAGNVTVTVQCQTIGNSNAMSLSIGVEDLGIGISDENQKNLFQPFSQGDSSIARKFGGSGLGLALSRRIAESLGGKLELLKSAPGKGSHFFFQIPVEGALGKIASTDTALRSESKTPNDLKKFQDKKILLAEDSADNAFLICHYIKSLGATIDIATDGLQAVSMAEQQSYNCILMDVQMPGMDGLEATRLIRSQGYLRPIIALTAHALPEETARSLQAGCNLHLTKPINSAKLISVLIDQMGPQNP